MLKRYPVVVLLAAIFPLPAAAAFLTCDPLSSGDPVNACKIEHLMALVVSVYNWLLGMAGLIAVIVIIVAGLGMLTHSFFEEPEQVLISSRRALWRGVTGFLIIACAYLIVNTLLALLGVAPGTAIGQLLQQFGLLQ